MSSAAIASVAVAAMPLSLFARYLRPQRGLVGIVLVQCPSDGDELLPYVLSRSCSDPRDRTIDRIELLQLRILEESRAFWLG